MENQGNYENQGLVLKALSSKKVTAVLIVVTESEILLYPVGGDYSPNIDYAIKTAAEKYPNCKMKLYEEDINVFKAHFNGVIDSTRYLW